MTDGKLILTRGLPASGKSTWAVEQATKDNHMRVNRDEIRFQLFGKFHGVDEDLVTEVETAMVRAGLREGKTVIVDAMHLQQRYINRWQRLGYPVEIEEFTAPLEILLARNIQRASAVPESVIIKNFAKHAMPNGRLKPVTLSPEQYQTSTFPKYVPNNKLVPAILVDVDGTLAHNDGHRSYYDYSSVAKDTVHNNVAAVTNAIAFDVYVLIVTGRPASSKEDTMHWLEENNIVYDDIYSRADGDSRPDALVKYEILTNKIAGKYNVLGVIDDRPSVCEMWRNVGVTTFQVGDPDKRF